MPKKPLAVKKRFDECFDEISREIEKKRSSWRLTSINWMDFDDAKAKILVHINNKWTLWDQEKPLVPWLRSIISRQLSNISRDIFYKFARPCLKCEFQTPNDGCSLFGKQCGECDKYLRWEKKKKDANAMNLASSYTNVNRPKFLETIEHVSCEEIDYEKSISIIKGELKRRLEPDEYKAFEKCYFSESGVDNSSFEKKAIKSNTNKYMKMVKEIIEEFELSPSTVATPKYQHE